MKTVVTELACACCGGDAATPLPKLSHFLKVAPPGRCVQCVACGLIYVSPRPDQTGFYDDAAYYQGMVVGGREEVAPHLIARLAEIERTLGHKGRFLDVGCALGVYVAYAAGQGWQAEGVDISTWATAQARERGLKVATGTLEAQGYQAGIFDVVHSSHVLEHVPNPLEVLGEMYRILAPGGLLSLEVPQEVFRLYEQTLERLGTRPAPTEPSPHLFFFTARALRQITEKAGFRLLWLRSRNPVEQWGKSKYPVGNAIKRSIFWLDTATLHGANLELLAIRRV
jgi:SAM-dependent methyltransferase